MRKSVVVIEDNFYKFEAVFLRALEQFFRTMKLLTCCWRFKSVRCNKMEHSKPYISYILMPVFSLFQMKAMWLSNLLRFLNNLEQYSGEERFIKFSSQKQGEQSLRNFDLSEYRYDFLRNHQNIVLICGNILN